MGHVSSSMSAEIRFLDTLAEAGFPVSSIAEIRQRFDPLPSDLAALLLEWLPRLEDGRLQESVAWALLGAPKGTLDGTALAAVFDAATSDKLKHAIAVVINQTRPRNIDEWLLGAIRDCRAGHARGLLAAAIAKMLPPERAVPVLMEVFHEAPLAVVHPLGKVGDGRVQEALAARLLTVNGPLRRELRQAISRIERRLANARRKPKEQEPRSSVTVTRTP